MDANTFTKIRSIKKRFEQASVLQNQTFFLPILNISEKDVFDIELCLKQIRQYTFLMGQSKFISRVHFDSYKIIGTDQLYFSGEFDLSQVGDIFVDLKMLLENKFKNTLIPFAERFLPAEIKVLDGFRQEQLEEILFYVHDNKSFNVEIDLLNFGYFDARHESQVLVRDVDSDNNREKNSTYEIQ